MSPDEIRIVAMFHKRSDYDIATDYRLCLETMTRKTQNKPSADYLRELEICMINRFMAKPAVEMARMAEERDKDRRLQIMSRELMQQSDLIKRLSAATTHHTVSQG